MIPENGIQTLYVFGAWTDVRLFSRVISGASSAASALREARETVVCRSVNGGSGGLDGRSARIGGE